MKQATPVAHVFLLSMFDREQWCPALQARIEVTDLNVLRSLLGTDSDDDVNLDRTYYLDDAGAAKLAEAFGIRLDWSALDFPNREFIVDRLRPIRHIPYLVHTGYELPLLLDGRKKLARMTDAYPPTTFAGEDRFDHWVAAGRLHKDVVVEPFGGKGVHPLGYLGIRTVCYTPKGEEWRIPAMKLIWDAALRSGGWNEHFERLEGMLYGYEDWQNDWWIETLLESGGIGGTRLWCTVDQAGLAWIKAAGYRALPPIDQPVLVIGTRGHEPADDTWVAEHSAAGVAAIAVFNVGGKAALDLFAGLQGPPWHLPASKIPDLNALLLRSIIVRPVKTDGTDG